MLKRIRQEIHLFALIASALAIFFAGPQLTSGANPLVSALVFAWLFAVVLWGAFAVVRHAEDLAHLLGEPYGTLVLTMAVTIIEVAFIISAQLSSGSGSTFARDTVFSVLMITMNGMAGLCLILGGLRYHEQDYNLQGTRSFIAVLVPVAVLALIMPNVTTTTQPTLSLFQAAIFALLILMLYAVFLGVQTVRHPYFFEQPERRKKGRALERHMPSRQRVFYHAVLLVLTLLPIIYLSKPMSLITDLGIRAIGAPTAFVGVLIAVIVLAPEGLSAFIAANRNQLQRSINIAFGSALATVGLTIPFILIINVALGSEVILGLEPEEMLLLALTFIVMPFTFGSTRTNVLVGAVHVVLFVAFIALLFDP
jgi:Ca2+:H+ antiporter